MAEEAPPPDKPDFSFGDELRKEREIRGISLTEIADATKISRRFLELIEKNDFSSLPAPVFTRGFVREYARYLGLNAEEMVDRYAAFARQTESPNDPQPQPLISGASADRPDGRRSINRVLLISAAVVVPLLIVAAFLLWRAGFFGNADRGTLGTAPVEVLATVGDQPGLRGCSPELISPHQGVVRTPAAVAAAPAQS